MKRRLARACALSAVLMAGVPAAAEAHISLRYFQLSPDCVTPGSKVNYSVGIAQNHWYHIHDLWSRVTVRHALTGVVVLQRDRGPQLVPYGNYSESGAETVPSNAPTGDYRVTLTLGYERGYDNWGSATRWLSVRPFSSLCIV